MEKKILITGASRGIGKATAIYFAKKKFSLVLTARSEKDLKEVAEICKSYGSNAEYFISDLSSIEKAREASIYAISRYQNITNLVLNAGISTSKRFENNNLEEIEFELGVNYLAPMTIIKEFIPYFKEKNSGSIVCISSFSALTPFPGNSSYAATKSAIYSLCNSLRIELAEYNIHIGSVLPGATKTDMTKEFESLPFIIESPESVAEAIFECIQNKESVVIPGLIYNAAAFAYKNFSKPIDLALELIVKNIFPKIGK